MAPDTSNLTAVGFLFLASMGVLMWSFPRRYALLPLLITTCYMPLGQMFVIGGLHFPFFRILLLLGVCRVITRSENKALVMTFPDKLFIFWGFTSVVLGTLTAPSFDRFINRSGAMYDAFGAYFLFRCWIRNLDDLVAALRFICWMILPLAISMIIEKFTTRNAFAVFGGVPAITQQREGGLRCQGAFRHPILAGTYGATLFPLFVALWFQRRRYTLPIIVGSCSAIVVVVAAHSSGALLAFISALLGFALWPMRHQMRTFRWAIIVGLVALVILMEAPVWFIIARISEFAGGTGWHRSYLIDQAIKHFDEWWLVGTARTAHWASAGQVLPVDPNNMDITNHYVAEGVNGGIVKLGLFLAIIVQGFKTVGRYTKRDPAYPFQNRILIWSLGVCLTAHCVSFISISYFDQIIVMWYWLLAILSMLAAPQLVAGMVVSSPKAKGRPQLRPVAAGF
jgi:hypothetical protein